MTKPKLSDMQLHELREFAGTLDDTEWLQLLDEHRDMRAALERCRWLCLGPDNTTLREVILTVDDTIGAVLKPSNYPGGRAP